MKCSITSLFALAASVSASLNCTVTKGSVNQHSCEWPTCPIVGSYKVGDMIMAACRSDCSSPTDVWFKLYNGNFLSALNVTNCVYHGILLQPTVLPYCYQETGIPKPTTCSTARPTATPAPPAPPAMTPRPRVPVY